MYLIFCVLFCSSLITARCLPRDATQSAVIQESRAVAEKPRDAAVKFDTYRNVPTSYGSPCDSTALVYRCVKDVLLCTVYQNCTVPAHINVLFVHRCRGYSSFASFLI